MNEHCEGAKKIILHDPSKPSPKVHIPKHEVAFFLMYMERLNIEWDIVKTLLRQYIESIEWVTIHLRDLNTKIAAEEYDPARDNG